MKNYKIIITVVLCLCFTNVITMQGCQYKETVSTQKENVITQNGCQYKITDPDEMYEVNGITILRTTEQPINGVACIFIVGRLMSEIPYKNGVIDGISKGYSVNGELLIEAPYKNGKREGYLQRYYSESGRLDVKILYNNNNPISGICGSGRVLNNAEIINWQNGYVDVNCTPHE